MAMNIETFVNMQTSPETRRAYARDLRVWQEFYAGVGMPDIETVIRFRDHLVSKYAPNGAVRVWTTVRSFFRLAHPDERSPFDRVKAPKRVTDESPRVPDTESVDASFETVTDPKERLVFALLLNGLRASEVCDLLKANVERHEGATILRVIGKGMKERLVPATVEVEQAMVRFWQVSNERQRASEYVVSDYDGGRLTYRTVEAIVYRAARRAGVEGLHPHALRHHYATRLLRAGVGELALRRLLGHASVATTQRYAHLDVADLIRAANLDPRNMTASPQEVRAVS